MVSKVVPLPECTEGASARLLLSRPAFGELIPFPSPSGGLTAADTGTLRNLILALQGEWRCQIERDGRRELWAVIGSRLPAPNTPSAFLISRVEGRLMLIDISSENRWDTVGFYDNINYLASALGDLVGWQSDRPATPCA